MLTQLKNAILPNQYDKNNNSPISVMNGRNNNEEELSRRLMTIKQMNIDIKKPEVYSNILDNRYITCQDLLLFIQDVQVTKEQFSELIKLLQELATEIKLSPPDHSVVLDVTGNILLYCIASVFSNYVKVDNLNPSSFLYPFIRDNSRNEVESITQMIDNYNYDLPQYKLILDFFYILLLKESNERNVYADYNYTNERFSKVYILYINI